MAESTIELQCAQCFKSFVRVAKFVTHKRKLGQVNFFCSTQCGHQLRVQRARIQGVCIHCNQHFERRPSSALDKLLLCSRRCGAERARGIQWTDHISTRFDVCECGNRKSTGARSCAGCGAIARLSMTLAELRRSNNVLSYHAKLRSHAKRAYDGPMACASCGYDLQVDICHVRGLADFPPDATIGEVNHPDNLIALDKRCHWEFDHGYLVQGNDGQFIRQVVQVSGIEPESSME